MAAIDSCRVSCAVCIRRNSITIEPPRSSLSCSRFFRTKLAQRCEAYRLRICCQRNNAKQCVPKISCLLGGNSEEFEESQKESAIDLKFPRRSLLVTFTCNPCGVRSQRLINRLAYEHGLVYVQCAGCSRYHKLVDNLGLVAEYNFNDEI